MKKVIAKTLIALAIGLILCELTGNFYIDVKYNNIDSYSGEYQVKIPVINTQGLNNLYITVSKDFNVGTYDDFKDKLLKPEKLKAFYDKVGKKYNLGTLICRLMNLRINTLKLLETRI